MVGWRGEEALFMRPCWSNRQSVTSLAIALAAIWLSGTAQALAQPPLTLPQPSQAASASQRIGLTDITITYHRPAVNKREIWGKLVPFGQVWRAGANENTVITFSTPVSVGGHSLPAGAYGLHMIPTEHDWTVIFNRESKAWGSFFYDEADDAARVTVTPVTAPFEEHLVYTFDGVTDKSVVAMLHWEKLAVPIRIDVDTPAVVTASLHSELRGLQGFSWQRLAQAADWCATNNVNLDEAAKWADQAVTQQENFTTLRAKATVVERKGDAGSARDLRAKSLTVATETDLNNYGYQLLGAGKVEDAIATFRDNVKRHPDSWNTYDSLGEGLATKGAKAEALENYRKALAMTKDQKQKDRISAIVSRLSS
jgi:predicted negative regulator of RcsB-dependent stress response